MRYFIHLAYNGTNYHGWQIQPNASSVQQTIEKALSLLLKEPISIVGAGRTDTGVHAKNYVVHFDTTTELCPDNLVYRLNSLLPQDIAIFNIQQVNDDMHARFSAKSRTYKYYIHTQKNVFNNLSMRIMHELDFNAMNDAAHILFNYIDFTSFSKLHTDVKTNNCTIMHAQWTQLSESEWVFTIKADRFLRNMVRSIVGTLLDIGTKKISIEDFKKIIESKNRCKAGISVPAQALFLVDIEY